MRLSLAAMAMAALVFSGITPGNTAPMDLDQDNTDGLTVGVGIICNTPQQMQRLVGLRMGGAEVKRAIIVVNKEAKDARACGIAAVAYWSDKMVDMKTVEGKLVQIVRISVVAAFNGQQWSRIPAMTQYALMEPEGYAI